jgi:hypothetical protein
VCHRRWLGCRWRWLGCRWRWLGCRWRWLGCRWRWLGRRRCGGHGQLGCGRRWHLARRHGFGRASFGGECVRGREFSSGRFRCGGQLWRVFRCLRYRLCWCWCWYWWSRRGRWRRFGRRGPVQGRSGRRAGLNAEHPADPRLGRHHGHLRLGRHHGHLRPGGRRLGASFGGRRSLRRRSRGGGVSGTAGLAA